MKWVSCFIDSNFISFAWWWVNHAYKDETQQKSMSKQTNKRPWPLWTDWLDWKYCDTSTRTPARLLALLTTSVWEWGRYQSAEEFAFSWLLSCSQWEWFLHWFPFPVSLWFPVTDCAQATRPRYPVWRRDSRQEDSFLTLEPGVEVFGQAPNTFKFIRKSTLFYSLSLW